ncbi:MAG: aldo/keto reductase [Gammaproteobacteria bacterium]|nr:aldo/keto reductase [Gammaproteobacteria bacterium]
MCDEAIQVDVITTNRLALGTAQFGMPYGIVNRTGQPDRHTVTALLERARTAGMDTLDTAIDYGDSEAILGKAGIDNWKIITKLPAIPDDVADVADWIGHAVAQSMQRLRIDSLHGLLLHRPAQLHEPRGYKIHSALEQLKQRGFVQAIGISIYEPRELDELNGQFNFDLVQAPLNVFNQELLQSGWLERLNQAGTDIHVRSVFLQGLLLQSADTLPERFKSWQLLWQQWYAWLDQTGLTPLQACLRFVLSFDEIDRVIIGIDSPQQLEEILAAADGDLPDLPADLCCHDPDLINPARWQAT